MTPFVAFGYRKTKTDKHKLEIDPSAGSVVQDIFKMKLRGMSQDAIANRLNELGILSPFEYKISSGSHYETGFRQKEQALWSSVLSFFPAQDFRYKPRFPVSYGL